MDNNYIKLSLTLVFILISISYVTALGLSSPPYWKDNPLKMYPGETKYIEFTLEQSIAEKEEAKATVSLINSEEISEIIGPTEFTVPPGSKDNKIILKISIPNEAEIGKTYNIKLSVRPLNAQQTGNIQAIIGYDIEFPILVADKSEVTPQPTPTPPTPEDESQDQDKSKLNIMYIILPIILIVIIIILYFIYRKNRFK